MTDDFAVLDFILVAAPVPQVATGLAKSRPEPGRTATARPGLISRLLRKGSPDPARGDLTVHPATSLSSAPLARSDFAPAGKGPVQMRLSGPVDSTAMTLVEFIEPEIGQSSVALALSTALPDLEVFYFRYSGARHPGADFAFHVYQDGRAVRRAASISFSGTSPEAQWTATDKGMPHPTEIDNLPPSGAPASDIMTPDRQASLLSALGIEPDTLFAPGAPRASVVVLSTATGGKPLASLGTAPPAPPAAPVATSGPPLALMPTDRSPAPLPAAPLPSADSSDWEAAVTALLLDAVEAGLPEDEQVPWLESLTSRLNAGEVEQALEAAIVLIDKGDRPKEVRLAAAERLRALYAHLVMT